MKKYTLVMFIACSSLMLFGQESTSRTKEVGLTFRGFDSFGMTYRVGKEDALWRFNSLIARGDVYKDERDSLNRENTSHNLSVSFGREYRRNMAEKLYLRYGADALWDYQKQKSIDDQLFVDGTYFYSSERNSHDIGLQLMIGLNYAISNKFHIGAEILPRFTYRTGELIQIRTDERDDRRNIDYKSDISGYNYGLGNSSALLSLVYQFRK